MNILVWMKYLLIAVGIGGTLYLVPIQSYSQFTFHSLLFLAMERVQQIWGRNRWKWGFLGIQAGYIYYISNLQDGGLLYILFYSTLFSLYPVKDFRLPLLFIVTQGVLLNLTVMTQPVTVRLLSDLMYLVIVILLFFVRYLSTQKEEMQYLYDSLRRHHYELEAAKKQVLEYAQKVERLAQVEERNRISKDIHDEIGHKLVRLKMMMEVVLYSLPVDREKGMEMLYQVRDQLAESLETLRRLVHRMKPDEKILKRYALKQLIEDFGRDSGVRVRFTTSGRPYELYPSEEVVLYRNAQEAMTNAIRHGAATEVDVSVLYHPDQVVLSVKNNGTLPVGNIEKGLGIRGMEERIELLGGHLEIEVDGQFVIRTILPHSYGR